MTEPDTTQLVDYVAGRLSWDDHETVELWLDGHSEAEVQRILEKASQGIPIARPVMPTATVDNAQGEDFHGRVFPYFTPDTPQNRYHSTGHLGAGGMGVVELASDNLLHREVAVKRSRARRIDESVHSFKERQRLFQREAEIVGSLEHPAIVPIHEIGHDMHGNPTMIMKRLRGIDFEKWCVAQTQDGKNLDLAEGARTVLRVAEALAYAHAHGVVHRDLKVDNIIVGDHGEVTVIDWGLAVRCDTPEERAEKALASGPQTGVYGTPTWMAPEQALAGPADPRMDVWALGGILLFLFIGEDPRSDVEEKTIVTAADIALPISMTSERLNGIPEGLKAVIKRCLSEDPQLRYADGNEVAEELRSWLHRGITKAQQPGVHLRAIALIRRFPMMSAIALTMFFSACGAFIVESIHHQNHRRQVIGLAEDLLLRTELGNITSVLSAHQQLDALEQRYGSYPAFTEAEKQLSSAHEVLRLHQNLAETALQLDILDQNFKETGPWANEIAERNSVMQNADIDWQDGVPAVEKLKKHPLSDRLLVNLAHLQIATLVHDKDHREHDHNDHENLNEFLSTAAMDQAWSALGVLFDDVTISAHEVVLLKGDGEPVSDALLEDCLQDDGVGNLILAVCAPNARLTSYAHNRILLEPDAFWPRVVLARRAIVQDDLQGARLHALVALGREGSSIWPQLSLAYIELFSGNLIDAQSWVSRVLSAHPEHIETRLLRAAILLQSGKRDQAQKEIDKIAAWHHFHLHAKSGGGHPMDMTIQMLRSQSVRLTPQEEN